MKIRSIMKKRRILLIALVAILTVHMAYAQKTARASKDRVNIVMFIADDLAFSDIGPYGNQIVRTPNLDGLANESLLFKQAFASSPTCAPSRSSIYSGLLPFRHGAHGNHTGVKEGTQSLVQYLQPLGYRVAIAGKYHVGPEDIFAFERVSKTNVPEPGFEKNPGLNWNLNMGPVDEWLSKRKKNDPFLLIVADHSPHVIWPEHPEYDPDEVDIPSWHIDTKDTRKSRARYYTDITKMDGNLGKLLQSLEKHKLSDNTIVVFTADQGPQWPFGKWTLYDYGIHAPLIVRWPGVVKGGSQTEALTSLVDLLPTFVEVAGGKAPENIDGQSFLPTLLGKSDSHREIVFASHTGDKLMNRAPERMLRTSRYKYILNLAPEILYTTHMDKAKDHDGGREYWDSWREKSFKDEHAAAVLWRYHNRPPEELYDLAKDPSETVNLAADPMYKDVMADFRRQMETFRESQGDFETGPEKVEAPSGNAKPQKPVAPYVFRE